MPTDCFLNRISILSSTTTHRDYEAARKSYQLALKYDKDNVQIMRDLAIVQMQLRDFEQACETNRALLLQKPLPQHWLSFAATSFFVQLALHAC